MPPRLLKEQYVIHHVIKSVTIRSQWPIENSTIKNEGWLHFQYSSMAKLEDAVLRWQMVDIIDRIYTLFYFLCISKWCCPWTWLKLRHSYFSYRHRCAWPIILYIKLIFGIMVFYETRKYYRLKCKCVLS